VITQLARGTNESSKDYVHTFEPAGILLLGWLYDSKHDSKGRGIFEFHRVSHQRVSRANNRLSIRSESKWRANGVRVALNLVVNEIII